MSFTPKQLGRPWDFRLIAEPVAEILFSAVRAWRFAIKVRTGRLDLPPDVPGVTEHLRRNEFRMLSVELSHALRVHVLPDDPSSRSTDFSWPRRRLGPRHYYRDAQFAAYEVALRW